MALAQYHYMVALEVAASSLVSSGVVEARSKRSKAKAVSKIPDIR